MAIHGNFNTIRYLSSYFACVPKKPYATMFDNLSQKLQGVFKKLKGHGKLKESDIKAALREVRLALLEADVHFKVAKDFIDSVHARAMGQEVMTSLT